VTGFAVMAAGNLLTAAAPWLAAAFAAQVLRGLAIPLADTHVTTYLQRTTPPQMLGRVLANVYGGRRLPPRGPGAGSHLAAHSLRDHRLWRPGRRGHHGRIAPPCTPSATRSIGTATALHTPAGVGRAGAGSRPSPRARPIAITPRGLPASGEFSGADVKGAAAESDLDAGGQAGDRLEHATARGRREGPAGIPGRRPAAGLVSLSASARA
jgi:hypothetical protein